ncbi:cation:proton antiporter, partial [Candidatus Microgenomates bacterium]|nr:cation:proton antiporter [Candidatus Microgenomates bacterium]MBI2622258.1 cation:proton antiporter [Candidatus Microgenomates bacterium]
MDPFYLELTIVLILATLFGLVANLLSQPTILGFILAGVLVGPLGFFDIASPEILDVLAKLGITFLLFIVGLELSVKELKNVGRAALIIGIGQIVATGIIGFLLALLFSFPLLTSLYIGLALTFSSTIMVIKLISDKKDLNSLYGKVSVGILLIQDVAVIIILILLSGLKGTPGEIGISLVNSLLLVLLKGVILFAIITYLSKKVFPRLVNLIARSPELLFLVSVSWALGVAVLVASPWVGFSIEIGGLLAGLALANSSEHFQIGSKIKPLRDLFITLFFLVLGMKMAIIEITAVFFPALIFSLFVIVGNPLIVLILMGLLGYKKRTSFFTGLAIAQISEFSFILVALGGELGHISSSVVGMITLVGIITFTISSYLILYNNKLYTLFEPFLGIFERKSISTKGDKFAVFKNHIVLVGVNRMGTKIMNTLTRQTDKLVVVDFNPDIIKKLTEGNVTTIFGDISDPEVLEKANVKKAKLIISTVTDLDDNLVLIAESKRA